MEREKTGLDRKGFPLKIGDEVRIIRTPDDRGDIIDISEMRTMAESKDIYKISDINKYDENRWHIRINTWWFKHVNIEKRNRPAIISISPKTKTKALFDPDTLVL